MSVWTNAKAIHRQSKRQSAPKCKDATPFWLVWTMDLDRMRTVNEASKSSELQIRIPQTIYVDAIVSDMSRDMSL